MSITLDQTDRLIKLLLRYCSIVQIFKCMYNFIRITLLDIGITRHNKATMQEQIEWGN